jgi:hypothetical protein
MVVRECLFSDRNLFCIVSFDAKEFEFCVCRESIQVRIMICFCEYDIWTNVCNST